MTTPPNHNTADQSGAMQPTSSADNAEPSGRMVQVGLMALLQCAASELDAINHNMLDHYADDVKRVYAAMSAAAPDILAPDIVPQVVQAPKKLAELIATLSLRVAEQTCCKSDVDLVKEADAALKSLAAPIVATVPSEHQLWNAACAIRELEFEDVPLPDCMVLIHEILDPYLADPSPTEQASDVRNAAPTVDIDQLVNRFLGWKLPQTFAPDCGISFKQIAPDSWPIGTNLFNAVEAMNMFSHCLDGVSVKAEQTASIEQRSYLQTKGIQDVEALELAAAIMTVVNGPWYPGGAVQIKAKIQEIILGNAALKSATPADKGNAPVGAKS